MCKFSMCIDVNCEKPKNGDKIKVILSRKPIQLILRGFRTGTIDENTSFCEKWA